METKSGSGVDYRGQLRSELTRRKMGNPKYSLRAFAKNLDLSVAFLSKILKGQKDLSPKSAFAIAEKLGYNDEETAQFCQLVQLCKADNPKLKHALARNLASEAATSPYHALDLDAFQAISDWYHYGILELSGCHGEKLESARVATRLGISREEAKSALNRLVRLGLLESRGGRWVKSKAFLVASSKAPSRAIRNFHLQMIEKARRAVEEVPMELRDISGSTIAISPDKIEIARQEIRAFRRRLAKLVDSSRPSEVYQLNVQFFPLSKPTASGRSGES